MKINYVDAQCPWCNKSYNGYDLAHEFKCYAEFSKKENEEAIRKNILGNITIIPIKRLIDLVTKDELL